MTVDEIPVIEDYIAGDTLRISFVVKNLDSDVDIKNLTESRIAWELRKRSPYGNAVTNLDGNADITVENLIPTEGAFDIFIDKGATESMQGTYFQVLEIEDQDGNQSTVKGPIIISGIGPNS